MTLSTSVLLCVMLRLCQEINITNEAILNLLVYSKIQKLRRREISMAFQNISMWSEQHETSFRHSCGCKDVKETVGLSRTRARKTVEPENEQMNK